MFKDGDEANDFYIVIKGTIELMTEFDDDPDEYFISEVQQNVSEHDFWKRDSLTDARRNIFTA